MATSTELIRAAEHMRQRCIDELRGDQVLRRAFYDAAEMLEVEAKRIRASEWDDRQMIKRIAASLNK